ncbi:nitroreductase family deazaflavin-dependent oxidoreductase [Nocardia sp. NPDC049220]|uniref:nitroreductase family deazaflavin-dependent oxidoreductase n=1 Tax=Nocardia sp. NPDC049220 TaxID=3155273 RepID=UPI0033DF608D
MAYVPKTVEKMFVRANTAAYRASRGKIGGSFYNAPVLLLTTTGRKSGKERTTPLLYLLDEKRYIVVASDRGAPKHPAWYLNLRDHPDVTVQIGSQRISATATEVTGEDRDQLWPRLVEMYQGYDDYTVKTTRTFPIVTFTPK